MDITDVHQLALNASVFWGFPGYVFILTMAFTGMRPAELYALRREYAHPTWPASDPDDEQREESIERYLVEQTMPAIRVQYQHQWKASVLTLLPPKYDSHRTLVIPRFLAELLEMLLDSHDSEWVFPSINGGPLAKANFTYRYRGKIADGRETSTPRSTWRPLPGWPTVKAYAGKRLYLLLAGVEGTYSNVTPTMERAIMDSLQVRWQGFVVTSGADWLPSSPKPLPVDLLTWMKGQVSAAQVSNTPSGS
ncbi:hypothetical protein P6B95_09170 [Streptomyces atratus]|uniref:hypothetical protein n=1 Tax=Streptomyces atratus TaxID=1893 RepID=UPI0016704EBF|nr:hypothetical protein [Streptomyces atratus]WPW27535.1 hypothetical protein P6B95_09170 [Streptomyces atratus]GGT54798.1 hypothetical protein GCM10010207_63440 [Streptomyces atratus]